LGEFSNIFFVVRCRSIFTIKKYLVRIIAVMFTFSFSTAFAFEAGTAPDTISDGYFETLWAEYVKAADTYEDFEISKAVLAGLKADAKVVYDAHMKTAEAYVTTVDGLKTILKANNTKAGAYRLAAAAAQFAADKDAALAKFATVPTYNYSAEEISTAVENTVETITGKVADGKSYQEAAEMLVAYYEGAIADKDDFDADVTVASYKTASAAVKAVASTNLYATAYVVDTVVALTGAYDLKVAYDGPTGTNADGVVYVSQAAVNRWSTESVAAAGQVTAAGIAAQKAQNAAEYAAFVIGKDSATVAKAAKWLKVADILAEEGVAAGAISANLAGYAAKADFITELEEYAAKYGAEKNAEGELVRDAAVVQVELEKGIVAIAKANVAGGSEAAMNAAKSAIYNAKSAVVADKLAFVKESAVKATELFLAEVAADEVYFAAEYAKVEAQVAKYVAQIEAAAKVADVEDAIETMQTKIDAIATADEVRTACDSGKYATAVNALEEYANAYVTYFATGKDNGDKLDATTLGAGIIEMVGESGLRTVSEIKKLTNEAVAVAQALPTNDAVAAAKKAVKAAVEAIPTKVTVDALTLVQAAADAQDAYEAMTTVDSTYTDEIAAAVEALEAAYNTSFVKAAATVAKTDEAAVKALLAEINATIAALDALGADPTAYLDGLADKLVGYLDKIQETEKEAVEAAIKAIPLNVTEADKAVVEKARELYDAYVAKYTNYEALYDEASYTAGYAADDIAISDLTAAETVLGLNVDEDAKIIASVEGLKIKANSSAKKGSITVKWTVTGNTEHVEKYQVYKSTKAQKGYKKAITTTKTSFKNTKNLEKGTRYYYKVRAYVTVDGVKYYSDWSNKANRIAK